MDFSSQKRYAVVGLGNLCEFVWLINHLIGAVCKLFASSRCCVTYWAALKAPAFDLVQRLNESLLEA